MTYVNCCTKGDTQVLRQAFPSAAAQYVVCQIFVSVL